jgi:hypothetical protein
MERWERAHVRLTTPAAPDDGGTNDETLIRGLRNTIEHLDDTWFTDYSARRNPADGRWQPSIDDLPGEEFLLGFGGGTSMRHSVSST